MNNLTENQRNVFQLKGSLFTLAVLHLLEADIVAIEKQLAETVKRMPKFFQNIPIVLDLQKLSQGKVDIDFLALTVCLRKYTLIPVGVRGGTAAQHAAALKLGLAVLPNTKPTEPIQQPITELPEKLKTDTHVTSVVHRTSSKLITQPVRSGQQIYAPHSDLIVLSSVSPGAELLADGHIHVYGTLRGRALAGVTGNKDARIFCQTLKAELISIAGHYWVNEDLQSKPEKNSVCVYLKNEKLYLNTYA